MSGRSVSEMVAATSPEMEALRNENRELKAAQSAFALGTGQRSEALLQVLNEVKVFEPPKKIVPALKKGKSTAPCSLVVHLTDMHIGANVRESEVEGFNKYNYSIACARMSQLASKLLEYTRMLRMSYDVDECVILGTSDWISGDIHEELLRTNEFPAPVQAVRAGYLVADFVHSMSAAFDKIRVEFIAPGNHDRITKKPQKADGGLNSWGYVAGSIAEQALKRSGVIFNLVPALQAVVPVRAQKYLIGHGAGIMGTWGIPWYGIERRKQREAMARMNMPEMRHFNKLVFGHFHVAVNHLDWNIGGSLSGTDANDHDQGRHAPAHQTSWVVHPSHGEFGFTRWWLD